MHPSQHITLVQQHVADLQASAQRHRLARRARRANGAHSPAPPAPAAGVEPIPLPILTAPNWRRPAA